MTEAIPEADSPSAKISGVAAEFTLLVHDDVACDIVSHVRDKLARYIKT